MGGSDHNAVCLYSAYRMLVILFLVFTCFRWSFLNTTGIETIENRKKIFPVKKCTSPKKFSKLRNSKESLVYEVLTKINKHMIKTIIVSLIRAKIQRIEVLDTDIIAGANWAVISIMCYV